ncbi:uncharacterized protein METZ01_LOCUS189220, partial [marine metagenome]
VTRTGEDLSGLPMVTVSGSHGNLANRKRV